MLKAAVRTIAGHVYAASPFGLNGLRGRVLILMYHRVIPRSELDRSFVQPGMYVTPETFDAHLRFLTRGFQMLSFGELLVKWNAGTWDANAKYCVITFDDGWLDNYVHAYPLMRAHGVPATIFLPTNLIGTDKWLWWDRLGYLFNRESRSHSEPSIGTLDSAIERAKGIPDDLREKLVDDLAELMGVTFPSTRRFINWDEAHEMSDHGIEFGSHTASHPILTALEPAALERELRQPLEALDMQGVNRVPVLCYPNGDYSTAVVAAARRAGYVAAVTTTPGTESSRPGNLFELKRVGVHDDVTRSIPLLELHIARQTWTP